jgi:hypothetical protein
MSEGPARHLLSRIHEPSKQLSVIGCECSACLHRNAETPFNQNGLEY